MIGNRSSYDDDDYYVRKPVRPKSEWYVLNCQKKGDSFDISLEDCFNHPKYTLSINKSKYVANRFSLVMSTPSDEYDLSKYKNLIATLKISNIPVEINKTDHSSESCVSCFSYEIVLNTTNQNELFKLINVIDEIFNLGSDNLKKIVNLINNVPDILGKKDESKLTFNNALSSPLSQLKQFIRFKMRKKSEIDEIYTTTKFRKYRIKQKLILLDLMTDESEKNIKIVGPVATKEDEEILFSVEYKKELIDKIKKEGIVCEFNCEFNKSSVLIVYNFEKLEKFLDKEFDEKIKNLQNALMEKEKVEREGSSSSAEEKEHKGEAKNEDGKHKTSPIVNDDCASSPCKTHKKHILLIGFKSGNQCNYAAHMANSTRRMYRDFYTVTLESEKFYLATTDTPVAENFKRLTDLHSFDLFVFCTTNERQLKNCLQMINTLKIPASYIMILDGKLINDSSVEKELYAKAISLGILAIESPLSMAKDEALEIMRKNCGLLPEQKDAQRKMVVEYPAKRRATLLSTLFMMSGDVGSIVCDYDRDCSVALKNG